MYTDVESADVRAFPAADFAAGSARAGFREAKLNAIADWTTNARRNAQRPPNVI